MPEQEGMLDPASRPSRLEGWAFGITCGLLAASFVSGLMVWRGLHVQEETLETPGWLRAAVVFHGVLNPLMCGLFGYLVCRHIRLGWALRANWVSGLLMEVTFGLLIVTGTGLYYVGGELGREVLEVSHRGLGVVWPGAILSHIWLGRRWAKKMS